MRTPLLALCSVVFAGFVLGAALAVEHLGGVVPCALCLVERWPYRVAIVFGLLAVLPIRPVMARAALWGVVLCMAASLALAATHVGVEQGWWPSPLPECAAPDLGGGSIAQRLQHMPMRPAKPCDSPTYLLPGVPVSMAAMNGIVALLFGMWLAFELRGRRAAAVPGQFSSSSESQ